MRTKPHKTCSRRTRNLPTNWNMLPLSESQTCLTILLKKCSPRSSSISPLPRSRKRKLTTKESWSSNCSAISRETESNGERKSLNRTHWAWEGRWPCKESKTRSISKRKYSRKRRSKLRRKWTNWDNKTSNSRHSSRNLSVYREIDQTLIVDELCWRRLKSTLINIYAFILRIQTRIKDKREATRLRKLPRLQHLSRGGRTSWSRNKLMRTTSGPCLVSTRTTLPQSPTASSLVMKLQVQSTEISLVSTWCLIARSIASGRTKITSEGSCSISRNGSPT